jgi:hypothetical protein
VLWAWAFALALVVLCLPVFSPDVWWHLSAARWMLAHGAVPRADAFTFTAFGKPWIDFEWGTQLAWYAVHALGGLWGLWLLKIGLLVAAFWPVDGFLREKGASGAARAGALALWLAAMLAQADLRADLISACFFALLLRRLENGRASFLFGFGLFALWANLHAGFVLGLGLYALAALTDRADAGAEFTGAALGSLLNPYGAGLYKVLFAHASEPAVTRFVMEWRAPSEHNAFQAPLLVAIVLVVSLAWLAARRSSKFLLGAALGTALAAALSARFGCYFAAAGAMFLFSSFPKPRAGLVAALLAAATAMLVPLRGRLGAPPYDDKLVARRASDFVAREQSVFSGLRAFNQYEWGGYLGWALGPDGRVFGDGRYLFHAQLTELQDALESPPALAEMAARERLDAFLIRNSPETMRTTRAYPDGTSRAFDRPWHLSFFPRERWALVYWDDQALIYVDRAKVPADWMAAHEYRWLKPGDEAARLDALTRGEIPRAALDAESMRHAFEVPVRVR